MIKKNEKNGNKVWFYRLGITVFVVLIVLIGTVVTSSAQQEEKTAFKGVKEQKEVKIELPEGFPKDIPIYPKSQLTGFYLDFSEHFTGGGLGTGFESPAKYKKKGWEILQKIDMSKFGGKGGELTVRKDERILQITISAGQEKDITAWTIMGGMSLLLPKKELEKHKQPRKYLPKDIPLYPGLEMLGVTIERGKVSVDFRKSKEDPIKMGRYLIKEFEKMGWEIKDKMGMQGIATFGANKDERAVHITIKNTEYPGEGFSKILMTRLLIGYTFKK